MGIDILSCLLPMIQRMRQVVLMDPLAWLGRIKAPTLLIWGEPDRMIPFANAADDGKAIPDVTLVRLVDVGHLPQDGTPERPVAVVRRFIDPTDRHR